MNQVNYEVGSSSDAPNSDTPNFLWTIKELEENAVANLGSMDTASYNEFVERMNKVAADSGIIQPILTIGIKFKEGAHDFLQEQPYPISREEWSVFERNAETMCEYMPNVFVVDGSRFSIPI